MSMKDKPYLILSISGDKDYVCDAYDHIRATYDIDKKHITKRTIESMLLEYEERSYFWVKGEGDRSYCYIPIFPSTKKLVRERVRYIMSRWDVNGIYCNASLKDIFPEILEICKFNCKECTIFETNKTNVDNANNDKHIGGSSMH